MEAAFFNIEGGFLEGIARGFKSAILTNSNYVNLTQCENLEGRNEKVVGLMETFQST
jgi:V-type H+-transporting ATPase subunit d